MSAMHTWEAHKNPAYLTLKEHTDALVRIDPMVAGYLWQYRKHYGYAATRELAQEWVEALAEHHSIPLAQRWCTL
jgi:hypothetical protein